MLEQRSMNTGVTRDIFDNHLFESNVFFNDFVKEGQNLFKDDILNMESFWSELSQTFDNVDSWGRKESDVSTRVIVPLLRFLDWPFLQKRTLSVQGTQLRPDFVLFQDENFFKETASSDFDSTGLQKEIIGFLEVESGSRELNTNKAKKEENPYRQLMEYLVHARKEQGFLCNGREMWFVDNTGISSEKRYVRVDLVALAKRGTPEDHMLFQLLFARRTCTETLDGRRPDEGGTTHLQRLREMNRQETTLSECELRDFIYGTGGKPSLIELVGRALFRTARSRGEKPDLADMFANAQYFAFRLLFLAFFESRYLNANLLPEKCSYKFISLHKIFDTCRQMQGGDLERYTEWRNLRQLFAVINNGDQDLHIPIFKGCLFSDDNAPMLAWPRLFSNRELLQILEMLFIYDGKVRDFSVLSVTQLGTIHEGLSGFEFRTADEKLWYLDYQCKGREREEGYFNIVEYAQIRKNDQCTIFNEVKYEKGNLYFVGNSNSRKITASYYTPSSLSAPLVRRAIDHMLAHLGKDRSILDIRILDSACGSGHLLVECLDYLTNRALSRIEDDPLLNDALMEEKSRIANEFVSQGLIAHADDLNVDETAILRRILLKKNIYGVDIQKFSVELTCLSLWIKTFVFGTPLSFLEHHIKQGNALIGCSRARLEKALTDAENKFGLLRDKFQYKRETLFDLYRKLSGLRDTTAEDIRNSKRIYNEEIQPIIEEMNLFFDCLTMKEILKIRGESVPPCRELFEALDTALHGTSKGGEQLRGLELMERIRQYRRQYAFFNWQLEFPEAFANGRSSGFHVIIGNPPWDKTKFSDADFFSQYRSSYRTLTNNRKREIRNILLDNKSIAMKYAST